MLDNIDKDIKYIEDKEIRYLLKAFKREKTQIENKKILIKYRKISRKDIKIIKKYISKNKEFFESIKKGEHIYLSDIEYFQSKLDWYKVIVDRVNKFLKTILKS